MGRRRVDQIVRPGARVVPIRADHRIVGTPATGSSSRTIDTGNGVT